MARKITFPKITLTSNELDESADPPKFKQVPVTPARYYILAIRQHLQKGADVEDLTRWLPVIAKLQELEESGGKVLVLEDTPHRELETMLKAFKSPWVHEDSLRLYAAVRDADEVDVFKKSPRRRA
jgi:hypothetical protein